VCPANNAALEGRRAFCGVPLEAVVRQNYPESNLAILFFFKQFRDSILGYRGLFRRRLDTTVALTDLPRVQN
jgi:hypothetical protein